MPRVNGKFNFCVAFIVTTASFRFRQMTQSKYLIEGNYFQYSEFLLNAFIGICWIRTDLIAFGINLILASMFVDVVSVYFSCTSLTDLQHYGTFRTKYFLDEMDKFPMERVVQAEVCLDILLNMIVIKALEVIEQELLNYDEEQRIREENDNE